MTGIGKAAEAASKIVNQQFTLDHTRASHLAFGALADLQSAGYWALDENLRRNTADLSRLFAAERRFVLPAIADATRLMDQHSASAAVGLFKSEIQAMNNLEDAIRSMSQPWLDSANQFASIAGFASLHNIGSLLDSLPAFDIELAKSLRPLLGDWREVVAWPPGIDTDPIVRSSFYLQQGLDPTLTAFPHSAFKEIVAAAGLNRPKASEAEEYRLEDVPDEEDSPDGIAQEADFQRTNDAHDLLQRFETQLRTFIERQMDRAFGPKWIRQRIPGNMRAQWLDRLNSDSGTQTWPPIAYADFTDYVVIITRNDNWQDLFEGVFRHKESVQESFRRLYPIRVATMHARPITQDDELFLYVEIKRILSAIGIEI